MFFLFVCLFVFLELSCFFDDAVDVGKLISGSSAFSKTSLKMGVMVPSLRSGCPLSGSLSPVPLPFLNRPGDGRHGVCGAAVSLSDSLSQPPGLQDLSSLTRDEPGPPAVEVLSPNLWTIREFPAGLLLR